MINNDPNENMQPDLPETIAKRIRDRRIEIGMTMDELAKKAGYKSKVSIHHIEHGDTKVPTKKVIEIADALGVTPVYLLGYTDDPHQSYVSNGPDFVQPSAQEVADLFPEQASPYDHMTKEELIDYCMNGDPDKKAIFEMLDTATPEDIKRAMRLIEAFLKK